MVYWACTSLVNDVKRKEREMKFQYIKQKDGNFTVWCKRTTMAEKPVRPVGDVPQEDLSEVTARMSAEARGEIPASAG